MNDFTGRIAEVLATVSLPPGVDARILKNLSNTQFRDNILFTNLEGSSSDLDVLASVLTMLISDPQEIRESVPIIFSQLDSHFDILSELSQGIYWHLIGYLAWKNRTAHCQALAHLNRSRKILKGADSKTCEYYLARVYDTFGQISYNLGNLEEAIEDFQLALNLRSTNQDIYGKALTYGSLGRAHMDLGNYEDAIDFLREDLVIMTNEYPEMTGIQAQLHANLGHCCLANKDLREAEVHYRKSLQLAEAHRHYNSQFFAYVGLGKIEVDRVNLEVAMQWKNKAFDIFQKHLSGPTNLEINGYLKHLSALISTLRLDLPMAVEEFKDAQRLYESSKFVSPTEMAHFLLDFSKVTSMLKDGPATAHILDAALTQLDSTTASAKRTEVELLLKANYREQWILHASRRLTGRDSLEKLLDQTGNHGFSVEKNKVVAMFADMRGFTRISESMDPEDLIKLLNGFLTSMIRAVDAHDGYVVQIQGDAILAVFSLQEGQVADADRSILAGLTMLEENQRLNDRYRDRYPTMNIGIGMHYGEVVTGLIGSPLKRSYTMIGDVVNTASRIEGLTKILGVPFLVTSEVISGLENQQFLFMPMGTYLLHGKKEPIGLFTPLAVEANDPYVRELKKWKIMAEKAFASFEGRDFNAAIIQFKSLQELTNISGFTYLIEQAFNFIDKPPGPGWMRCITVLSK